VEKPHTSEHLTPVRCHYHSLPTRFELDGWWGLAGVHQEESQRKSAPARRYPSRCVIPCSPRSQLSDIAKGLCYLHSCNVIHGDLKGVRGCSKSHSLISLTSGQANILVDNSGSARVADFGLATVTKNLDSTRSTSCQRGHTARWAAPEVLSEGTFSKWTDIFSFAMVMTEVRHRRSTTCRILAC